MYSVHTLQVKEEKSQKKFQKKKKDGKRLSLVEIEDKQEKYLKKIK